MTADILLTLGATLRLTRFVTTDSLGDWTIVQPAHRWAIKHEGSSLHYADNTPALDEDAGWRSKLVSGLECPFCVGFWIGAGVLASDVATRDTKFRPLWRFVTGALTLNYAAAHTASRLDSN